MLKIRNSLTGQKELFKSLTPNKVLIYTCGVTTYDRCHIGHATQALAFDMIVSYFKYLGYEVKYVRNYTDVDDKILKAAQSQGIEPLNLSKQMIYHAQDDYKKLDIKCPDHEPKVSEMIEKIIDFIKDLIDADLAYVSQQGHVYYSVKKFPEYGILSKRVLKDMLSQTRDTVSDGKKDPHDFALWKAEHDGNFSWQSPWSKGRPGWHIECSTMIAETLGESIDIHGGGRDLLFPHHENEIAQSQGLFKKPFVKYWVHSGLVKVQGQKMSKSLKNHITIASFLDDHPAELLRFFYYSHHYRSDVDFSQSFIKQSEKQLFYIYETLLIIEEFLSKTDSNDHTFDKNIKNEDDDKYILDQNSDFSEFKSEILDDIIKKNMDDDFNSPLVLTQTNNYFNKARYFIEKNQNCHDPVYEKICIVAMKNFKNHLKTITIILNLFSQHPATFIEKLKSLHLRKVNLDQEKLQELIAKRNEHRKNNNYEKADQIRASLKSANILLRDDKTKSGWTIDYS